MRTMGAVLRVTLMAIVSPVSVLSLWSAVEQVNEPPTPLPLPPWKAAGAFVKHQASAAGILLNETASGFPTIAGTFLNETAARAAEGFEAAGAFLSQATSAREGTLAAIATIQLHIDTTIAHAVPQAKSIGSRAQLTLMALADSALPQLERAHSAAATLVSRARLIMATNATDEQKKEALIAVGAALGTSVALVLAPQAIAFLLRGGSAVPIAAAKLVPPSRVAQLVSRVVADATKVANAAKPLVANGASRVQRGGAIAASAVAEAASPFAAWAAPYAHAAKSRVGGATLHVRRAASQRTVAIKDRAAWAVAVVAPSATAAVERAKIRAMAAATATKALALRVSARMRLAGPTARQAAAALQRGTAALQRTADQCVTAAATAVAPYVAQLRNTPVANFVCAAYADGHLASFVVGLLLDSAVRGLLFGRPREAMEAVSRTAWWRTAWAQIVAWPSTLGAQPAARIPSGATSLLHTAASALATGLAPLSKLANGAVRGVMARLLIVVS